MNAMQKLAAQARVESYQNRSLGNEPEFGSYMGNHIKIQRMHPVTHVNHTVNPNQFAGCVKQRHSDGRYRMVCAGQAHPATFPSQFPPSQRINRSMMTRRIHPNAYDVHTNFRRVDQPTGHGNRINTSTGHYRHNSRR